MSLRILNGLMSLDGSEVASALVKIESGGLVGGLTGGLERPGIARFEESSDQASCWYYARSEFLLAWVGFMSQMVEQNSTLAAERAGFYMKPGVRHELWQQVKSCYLEHVMIWLARFMAAKNRLVRFGTIVGVPLVVEDPYGVACLLWPALHPDSRAANKETWKLWAMDERAFRWLDGVVTYDEWESYKLLFGFVWKLYVANGQPKASSAAGAVAQAPSGGSSGGNQRKAKNCKHWMKSNECKFGDKTGCKDCLHSQALANSHCTPSKFATIKQ